MRYLNADDVRQRVEAMILNASRRLPDDARAALDHALAAESSPHGRAVLAELRDNARYAEESGLPLCQDTGTAVFFVEHGEDVRLVGATLRETLERATRDAWRAGYLRNSLCHPFTRANTGDNTPISLHVDLVAGDGLRIRFLPKGGGAENMSRLTMLTPSQGREGVKAFALRTLAEAGAKPCPPVILGLGVGGGFDTAPLLAKEALLLPLDAPNPDAEARALEEELLAACNALGIGPGGLGGNQTCLAVRAIIRPCHIASLPVAVNIQCNAARRGEVTL